MKVGIVGSGLVGATAGYTLVMHGIRTSALVIRSALDPLKN